MMLSNIKKVIKISIALWASADAQEVDDLDEQPRVAAAGFAHGLGECAQARQKAVVTDSQQRPGGDVADAGGLDNDGPGAPFGEPPVPVKNVGRHDAVFRGAPGDHRRHPGAVIQQALAVAPQRERLEQARTLRFLAGRPAPGFGHILDAFGRTPHSHGVAPSPVSRRSLRFPPALAIRPAPRLQPGSWRGSACPKPSDRRCRFPTAHPGRPAGR